MRNLRTFIKEEDGMGTVEIVLIIVVLISLVAVFREGIQKLLDTTMKTITKSAGKIK